MIGVGVIGAGLMGSIHARLLAHDVPGARLTAVCDPDRAAAERLDAPTLHADGFALIADPAVDAVVIASPVPTHEPFTLACVAAGKPVLCEKPLTATSEAARRIVEAERASGRRLVTVGFMRRHDPAYVELKAQLDAGTIGRPLLVHCAHRNPSVHAFFDSAMIITDSAVHEADIVRWLLGEEIVSVDVRTPRSTSRAREGLRDPQLILLTTASDVLVDVEAFVTAGYGYDIRCEVVGEDGTLALPLAVATGFEERFADAYRNELIAWLSGEPVGATAADGLAAAAVCEAGVRSLAEGRATPVAC
ncbi:Gfo/Idh/MocA family oxidoreductase [Solirubrobacter phytolaccae]|uniref:Gfo/Idh/MocA family oxidoreductase n=1 Tax=Solirubrobacter phytolaccae TaxID=1404360 RepID=A0A9X3N7G4_9ACTN|nr:Gfo/Idh/MocA family oxidoreductase [Solirubrobacter phytolaccae]MDA0181153.1 Gfo/Idh/MocA family oxidoreductase [Solirubrobacter phytolaccae]